MFKKIFKNMSQESTENIEKEEINSETVSENQEVKNHNYRLKNNYKKI